MDDRQLMASIAGGDEAALQALLRRFTPLFLYILRPILPDERDSGPNHIPNHVDISWRSCF